MRNVYLHLKKVLYGFSLAYPNCQHYYSRALGPFLSKTRVTWTQALQYCDDPSADREDYEETNRWIACAVRMLGTQEWVTFWAERSRKKQDFIAPLRTACSLKITDYFFLEFLDYGWPEVSEVVESKTMGRMGLLYRKYVDVLWLFYFHLNGCNHVCIFFVLLS